MTDSIIPLLRASGVECFTRAEWGSPAERAGAYARRRHTHPMPAGPADFHFLHITVTADSDTVQEGAAGARQVETYGYSSPPMVSYQDLVTNEGRYFEGQSYRVKGTHTVNDKGVPGYPHNLNLAGYACALMQNVGDAVTDVQVDVVARVFAARELAGLVRRGAPILPHRMFAPKSCPGDRAVFRLAEIVRLRDKYVREGLPRGEEGDTELSWNEQISKWHPGDKDPKDQMKAGQQLNQARGYAQVAYTEAREANARAKRLEKAIAALAKGLGGTVEEAVGAALAETLPEALAEAAVDVKVTVAGREA